jgi:hypothetical protein
MNNLIKKYFFTLKISIFLNRSQSPPNIVYEKKTKKNPENTQKFSMKFGCGVGF